MLSRVFAILLNTYREAARDKILLGVLGLAGALLVFTLALAELSLDQQERVITDLGVASVSFFSVLASVFLGSSLLYKEIEKKTLYVVLPRPIQRWEFLLGKFLGIVTTVGLFAMLMGATQLLVAAVARGGAQGPGTWIALGIVAALGLALGLAWRFGKLTALLPAVAIAYLIGATLFADRSGVPTASLLASIWLTMVEVWLLTAITFVFGAFSTPFLTGAFTCGIWMVGRNADALSTLRTRLLDEEIKAVLRQVGELVPNFHLFVPSRSLLESPELGTYVSEATVYGVVYGLCALALAAGIFSRRDFV